MFGCTMGSRASADERIDADERDSAVGSHASPRQSCVRLACAWLMYVGLCEENAAACLWRCLLLRSYGWRRIW